MAIGDDAVRASYSLVPDTGEDGKVKWGAREINRTRDYIALVKKLIPTSNAAYRTKTGILQGTAAPAATLGTDGDIYLQIL